MKIDQAVLDAHAQFGGDLETMQKTYEHADLVAEITRLRQLLSEAEKREQEARAKALEEAAAYHDDLAAQHAASHDHVESDHHEMMERQHVRFAASIRALQSEER